MVPKIATTSNNTRFRRAVDIRIYEPSQWKLRVRPLNLRMIQFTYDFVDHGLNVHSALQIKNPFVLNLGIQLAKEDSLACSRITMYVLQILLLQEFFDIRRCPLQDKPANTL
ncbi:hypothetical protein AVEN_178475-1 [Araneus ventricosus]|uniref:Uncharacterized protein n=1 Tax=Araneus ventricosus TaxID=182803 RepID=A0A4Y2CE60_ARAVE|nr:hypothetical protein AVEN_178475-1 [Araneus ventricosus]